MNKLIQKKTTARTSLRTWQARYENFLSATGKNREAVKRVGSQLNRVFSFFPHKRYPQDFSRLDIEDYRVGQSHRLPAAERELHELKMFWRWIMGRNSEEVPAYNPVGEENSIPRRVKDPEPRYLSQSQLAVLNADEKLHTRCLAAWVMLNTGLKCSEIRDLSWGKLASMGICFPFQPGDPENRVVESRNHFPLKLQSIEAMIRRYLLSKGINKAPGSLRWTWALEALRRGVEPEAVKERLGVKVLTL